MWQNVVLFIFGARGREIDVHVHVDIIANN